MLYFDYDKCIGCHQCVNICPFNALTYDEKGRPARDMNKGCMRCMHCATICPKGAINYDGQQATSDTPFVPFDDITREKVTQAILQRRSYRNFLDKPIPNELLEEVLRYAAWAPSAKNQHPVKWMVIRNEERKMRIFEKILEYVRETGKSPEIASEWEEHHNNVVMGKNSTLLMGYCKKTAINPPHDTAIALTTVELLLQTRGIGSCWAGYLTRLTNTIEGLPEIVGIPEDHILSGTLMIGWPDGEKYKKIPQRFKPTEISWID